MPEFILKEGSLQAQFLASTNKFQVYGGGYGNGKTTALVIKALNLCKHYPGSSGLLARSTYPKLNDTLRKEFIKWCPKEWIKSFPTGQNASNVCVLKNGTSITFRYIAQQGKAEGGTSNLLSANYDWIGVDQIEDPEISYKDFLDLLGRLRGNTRYQGDDSAMPLTGPRWMMITCNPTGNWVYSNIVKPLHTYNATKQIDDKLLCIRDIDHRPVLKDGNVQLTIDLFEGSTYELRHIHEADGGDFIQTLESAYTGQQRDRFLLGKWASYEGLVYPTYDVTLHALRLRDIQIYLDELRSSGFNVRWIEGYDFGIASPSCYMLAFVAPNNTVIGVDGFYRKEFPVEDQAEEIKRIRRKWLRDYEQTEEIDADPAIFKRTSGARTTIGKSTKQLFADEGIEMRKGNNDIMNGIVKVQGYLKPQKHLSHPVTSQASAPRFFHNVELIWLSDEFASYYWASDGNGGRENKPVGNNDHAMDMLKYLLSTMPNIGKQSILQPDRIPSYMSWHDTPESNPITKRHRYG
jgi:hypothetical protein